MPFANLTSSKINSAIAHKLIETLQFVIFRQAEAGFNRYSGYT